MWYIHRVNYYWAIKITKMLIGVRMWINPENTMLNEKHLAKKATYYMIVFV